MRGRPLTWSLVSVFCFVGAAYFWRLGDEWAAKRAIGSASPSTNQAPPAARAPKPLGQLPVRPLLSKLLQRQFLTAQPISH